MPGVGNLNPVSAMANGTYPISTFGILGVYNGKTIRELRGQSGHDSAGDRSATRQFLVENADDYIDAYTTLRDGPVTITGFDGLALNDWDWEPIAPGAYKFELHYSSRRPNVETGYFVTSIDTTGGQLIQTYGYSDNTVFNATGETGSDFGKLINVQDGVAQGISRVIPVLKLSITARIATEYVVRPMLYAKVISSLTGFTNSQPMFQYQFAPDPPLYEFAAGELLFTGATGTIVAENPQLTFNFLYSANVTGLTIGDITGIAKDGHELLWYEVRDGQESGANRRSPKIVAAHVSQVYGSADLNDLEIGTLPT